MSSTPEPPLFSNLRVVQRPVADQAVVVLLDPVGELGLLDFAIKLDGIGLQLGGHALGAVQHDGVLLRGVRAGEVSEADGLAEGGGSLSREFEIQVKFSFFRFGERKRARQDKKIERKYCTKVRQQKLGWHFPNSRKACFDASWQFSLSHSSESQVLRKYC